MHRILKQTVELSIGQHTDALAVQDRISQACQGGGLLALDRVFDRLAGDRVVRVARMELDLGEIRGDDWLAEFVHRLAVCAERTLAESVPGAVVDGRIPMDDRRPGFAESISERSQEQAWFDALAAFLRRGRVPWWSDLAVDQAWVRNACARLTSAGRRDLIDLVARHPRALRRLVIHLQAQQVEGLLGDGLPPGLAGRLAPALALIESHLALPSMRIWEWRAAYWEPLFRFLQAGQHQLEPATVVRHWYANWEALLPHAAETLPETIEGAVPVLDLPRGWRQAFREVLRRAVAADRSATLPQRTDPAPGFDGADPSAAGPRKAPASAGDGGSARPSPDGGRRRPLAEDSISALRASADRGAPARPPIDRSAAPLPPGTGPAREEADEVEGEALYVTGAGMVLLHPFLGELFHHLGLVDQGEFVDEDARQVAVQVLGYLAFGSEGRGEAELTLAKLLCGMPLDEVAMPVELSTGAIEGADELLAAVLKHWAALKTSSAAWLREQFFLRTGKLQQVDAGWKLVVESRAQDVLLAKLPWGVGVIALPWRENLLHVSWGD
jgi:hypothetical protein